MLRFNTNWSEFTPLPANADELISDKVQTERESLDAANFGSICESSRVAIYRDGKQVFAVMRNRAYELFNIIIEEEGEMFAYRPALLNGIAFRRFPHEGASGTLHWLWTSKYKNEWFLTWATFSGWIHTDELSQSPQEISDNIEAEVDAGKTPISKLNDRPENQ